MPLFGTNIMMGAAGSAADAAPIQGTYDGKSILFEDSSSEVLERTPGSQGDRDIWTFSCWFKRAELGSYQSIFAAWSDDNNRAVIRFTDNDNINYQSVEGGTTKEITTNKRFKDTTSWYHLCLTVNDGLKTETDRYRVFINGVEETDIATNTAHFRSGLGKICDDARHFIGARAHGSGPTIDSYYSGYLSAVKLIDGQALLPTAFGEFNDKTGAWVPKDYANKTSQIAQGTGTAFGDMDQQGGLSAAFDGTRVQAYTAGAASTGLNSTSFIGKDWGSGNSKTVTGFAIYGSSDYGAIGGAASTFTVKLFGSNSSPSNSTDGTLLYTTSAVTDDNNLGHVRWFEDAEVASHETVSSFTKTAFRYSWLTVTPNATDGVYLPEVEFYEQGSSSNYGTTGFDLDFKFAGGIERGGETEFTLTSATVLSRSNANDSSAYFNHVLTGNFRFDWRAGSTSYGSGDGQRIGVIPATQRRSWNHGVNNGGSSTNWFVNFGSSGVSDGQAFEDDVAESHTAVTYSTSTVFSLRRESGSTIKLYVDGSASHTYGTTSSDDMVFYYGAGDKINTGTITNFSLEDDGNGNSGNFHTISLGNDISGNNNDWSIIEGASQSHDTPIDNFATWSSIHKYGGSSAASVEGVFEGNTKWQGPNGGGQNIGVSTFSVDASQDTFVEFFIDADGAASIVGILPEDEFAIYEYGQPSLYGGGGATGAQAYYSDDGDAYLNAATGATYGNTWTTGDAIGMRLNNGSLFFYKNGTIQNSGTAAATSLTGKWLFAVSGESGTDVTIRVSAEDWANTPTGMTTSNQWSTANLPDPTIGTTDTNRADQNVSATLYSGNAAETRTISGIGFQPDLVWQKIRAGTTQGTGYWDALRGFTGAKALDLAENTAEGTTTGASAAEYGFVSGVGDGTVALDDGTTAGTGGFVNHSGRTYVLWCWKGQGSTSTLGTGDFTQGSIASTCRRNVDAGFSIVSYTGTGSAGTVGHGLSAAPEMILVKKLVSSGPGGAQGGDVYHVGTDSSAPEDYQMDIDNNNARYDGNAYWNDTAPTSTVFSVESAGSVNESSAGYIAYCWHSVDGFSKMGSYTGNNNSNGPRIYCGFRPAILITKRADSSDHWRLIDSARHPHNDTTNPGIKLNETEVEADAGNRNVDFLSNGFKIRDSDADMNASGGNYIYMAWAEVPFKFGKGF